MKSPRFLGEILLFRPCSCPHVVQIRRLSVRCCRTRLPVLILDVAEQVTPCAPPRRQSPIPPKSPSCFKLVRELIGTVEGSGAQVGVLIVRDRIRPEMRRAAASAGYYTSPLGHEYAKNQFLTIRSILDDEIPNLPGQESHIVRRVRRAASRRSGDQLTGRLTHGVGRWTCRPVGVTEWWRRGGSIPASAIGAAGPVEPSEAGAGEAEYPAPPYPATETAFPHRPQADVSSGSILVALVPRWSGCVVASSSAHAGHSDRTTR
jgi:hypothetical protein